MADSDDSFLDVSDNQGRFSLESDDGFNEEPASSQLTCASLVRAMEKQ